MTGDESMTAKTTPDVLNALVRVILVKTAAKAAPALYQLQNATAARVYFKDKCGYCRECPPIELDHAVPSNRVYRGEHCIGNLIPSCRKCNDEKGQADLDFRQFLSTKEGGDQRIADILNYMKSNGYIPSNDPAIRVLLDAARADVASIIDKCVAEIRKLS
jgi:hypothetical protein